MQITRNPDGSVTLELSQLEVAILSPDAQQMHDDYQNRFHLEAQCEAHNIELPIPDQYYPDLYGIAQIIINLLDQEKDGITSCVTGEHVSPNLQYRVQV